MAENCAWHATLIRLRCPYRTRQDNLVWPRQAVAYRFPCRASAAKPGKPGLLARHKGDYHMPHPGKGRDDREAGAPVYIHWQPWARHTG